MKQETVIQIHLTLYSSLYTWLGTYFVMQKKWEISAYMKSECPGPSCSKRR